MVGQYLPYLKKYLKPETAKHFESFDLSQKTFHRSSTEVIVDSTLEAALDQKLQAMRDQVGIKSSRLHCYIGSGSCVLHYKERY